MYTEATEPCNGSSWLSWRHHFESLRSPPWLDWPLWNICVTKDHGYVPLVANTTRSFPRSWLITGFVTTLTRQVPLVEQELLTLPEHQSSPLVFSGVRVTRSLVLCVCFVDRCLFFFFWPLCCLFLFDIRILITPLVSSNSSCSFYDMKIFQETRKTQHNTCWTSIYATNTNNVNKTWSLLQTTGVKEEPNIVCIRKL